MTSKKKSGVLIFALIAGAILFSSFTKKKKLKGAVYVDQLNAPAGTKQVYSNVGTQVYNRNNDVIYTFDTANIGSTVTFNGGDYYDIVLGDDFNSGISGWVLTKDIQII